MTDILISIGIPSAYAGDVALFLLMVLAGVTLMFIVKKTKIGAFAFAIYVAYLITETADFDFINTYVIKSSVFLIVAMILHYALFRPAVVIKLGGGNMVRWVKRIAISFTIVGFIASIILGWMPDKVVLEMLSPFGLKVFATSFAKLIWTIAPVATLLVVRKRE
jgi:hypothetical protein